VRDFEVPEARWLEALGVTQTRLQCSSVETQLAAVRAGLGVALAPRAITMVSPGLVALELKGLPPLPRLELFVVTRSAIRKVPRIAAVFDALVSVLGELERSVPVQRNKRS
jgi:DNA-binding transcriptional LysR family regulator